MARSMRASARTYASAPSWPDSSNARPRSTSPGRTSAACSAAVAGAHAGRSMDDRGTSTPRLDCVAGGDDDGTSVLEVPRESGLVRWVSIFIVLQKNDAMSVTLCLAVRRRQGPPFREGGDCGPPAIWEVIGIGGEGLNGGRLVDLASFSLWAGPGEGGMSHLLVDGRPIPGPTGLKTRRNLLNSVETRGSGHGASVTAIRFEGVDQPTSRGPGPDGVELVLAPALPQSSVVSEALQERYMR